MFGECRSKRPGWRFQVIITVVSTDTFIYAAQAGLRPLYVMTRRMSWFFSSLNRRFISELDQKEVGNCVTAAFRERCYTSHGIGGQHPMLRVPRLSREQCGLPWMMIPLKKTLPEGRKTVKEILLWYHSPTSGDD